jgi:hypothetical protein
MEREDILIENTWIVLIVIAVCSYLAVKAWVNARRAEREALYRSETLKKLAEMQGNDFRTSAPAVAGGGKTKGRAAQQHQL